MAIIRCIDCSKNFSEHAIACPSCGCPTKVSIEKSKDINSSTSHDSSMSKKKSNANHGLTLGDKIFYTVGLWFGWAIFASFVFGDGPIGTIIQGVVQIGGTVYVWRQPTIKKN